MFGVLHTVFGSQLILAVMCCHFGELHLFPLKFGALAKILGSEGRLGRSERIGTCIHIRT